MLTPNPAVAAGRPYSVPRARWPVDLRLDGNEGAALPPEALAPLAADPAVVQRYPDNRPLEAALAARFDLDPSRVILSAGGDDLIDRCCRALVAPGRAVVLPEPGFAMTRRYAQLAGARLVTVDWPEGPFPTQACLDVDDAAMIVLTSPNNPTGAVGSVADVDRLCSERPDALILVDAAYAEFGDVDLTEAALRWPNAVVIRTLSKAWGLAGLRIGYALGDAQVIGWLRAAGAPYPVSGPSQALALDRLAHGEATMRAFVAQARRERAALESTLAELGATVIPGQANFAFARVPDALALRDGLAQRGIGIRAFPDRPGLTDAVRISVPGDEASLQRLLAALRAVLAPPSTAQEASCAR